VFEGGDGVAVGVAHGHEYQRFEGQSKNGWVEMSVISADYSRLLECSQAAMAGRDAETDAIGELGERKPTFALELRKNLPINNIHIRIVSQLVVVQGKVRNIFRLIQPSLSTNSKRLGLLHSSRELGGMPVATIAAFWGVSMLFVVTPGADWAYVIGPGLRNESVLPAVGGLLSGHLAATLVVAAGVAALLASSPVVMTVLTVVGAAYLVWLGIGMLRRPATVEAYAGNESSSRLRQAIKGAAISGLNPKVFLLFLALLPQFVVAWAAWPVAVQIVVLGLVHVANCAVVYTGIGVGSRTVLRTRPLAARAVSRVSGAAMIIIGVMLVAERIGA
jgi:threonine/homoserine/homoserine lactone efflux protein